MCNTDCTDLEHGLRGFFEACLILLLQVRQGAKDVPSIRPMPSEVLLLFFEILPVVSGT